jgi:hypothetical protein
MAKHEERELRIVDVKGTLSAPEAHEQLALPKSEPSRLTPADALKVLRSMKGAAGLIKRVPALGNPAGWHEVAHWGVCNSGGSALVHGGPLYWDLDDSAFNLQFHVLNCSAVFHGAETFLGPTGEPITPPQNLTGQVWCELDVPVQGVYLFVARFQRLFLGGPSEVEFCIDNVSLGQVTLTQVVNKRSFVLRLSPGRHRFQIRQVEGSFVFKSVSAWHVLEASKT